MKNADEEKARKKLESEEADRVGHIWEKKEDGAEKGEEKEETSLHERPHVIRVNSHRWKPSLGIRKPTKTEKHAC